jgi:hypothetical protein
MGTGCLVAQDLVLLTKVRTLIDEEISLLTVLYFPFRARTPGCQQRDAIARPWRLCKSDLDLTNFLNTPVQIDAVSTVQAPK